MTLEEELNYSLKRFSEENPDENVAIIICREGEPKFNYVDCSITSNGFTAAVSVTLSQKKIFALIDDVIDKRKLKSKCNNNIEEQE